MKLQKTVKEIVFSKHEGRHFKTGLVTKPLPVFLPQVQVVKMDDGGRDDYLDPIFPGQREGCLHASRG